MIHEEGAFCIKHSDGNLYPLLDMIVSAGPTVSILSSQLPVWN